VPESVVAVWLTTWNWKLPQVFTEGSPAGRADDVHKPTSDEFEDGLLFALLAGADAAAAAALGAATLVECSKPQATVRTEAAARATQFDSIFFITNL